MSLWILIALVFCRPGFSSTQTQESAVLREDEAAALVSQSKKQRGRFSAVYTPADDRQGQQAIVKVPWGREEAPAGFYWKSGKNLFRLRENGHSLGVAEGRLNVDFLTTGAGANGSLRGTEEAFVLQCGDHSASFSPSLDAKTSLEADSSLRFHDLPLARRLVALFQSPKTKEYVAIYHNPIVENESLSYWVSIISAANDKIDDRTPPKQYAWVAGRVSIFLGGGDSPMRGPNIHFLPAEHAAAWARGRDGGDQEELAPQGADSSLRQRLGLAADSAPPLHTPCDIFPARPSNLLQLFQKSPR